MMWDVTVKYSVMNFFTLLVQHSQIMSEWNATTPLTNNSHCDDRWMKNVLQAPENSERHQKNVGWLLVLQMCVSEFRVVHSVLYRVQQQQQPTTPLSLTQLTNPNVLLKLVRKDFVFFLFHLKYENKIIYSNFKTIISRSAKRETNWSHRAESCNSLMLQLKCF